MIKICQIFVFFKCIKMPNDTTCKLAYAADGTLICDPKKKSNIQGTYTGKPTCSEPAKCTVFGKFCRTNKEK